MAAVYRGRIGGARVRVRSEQGGRALEIDGTFASWWAPGRVATGSVWDALAAALLALAPERRRTVLLLGVGGASVARVVRSLAPQARIVGVEVDPEVVRAARRWFGLDALGLELVLGDARAYLERTRRRFDLVLDDVFVGRGEAVRKPDWFPEPALALAARRLRTGGVLATNVLDVTAAAARTLHRLGFELVEIQVEGFDNRILVGRREGLRARALRTELAHVPELAGTLPRLRLRTRRPRLANRGRRGCRPPAVRRR